MTSEQSIRLNKFISDSGYCSRREADRLIDQGFVLINDKVTEVGMKVEPGDKVVVNGTLIRHSATNKSDRIYLVYNKPIGITCTTEPSVRGNIIQAIGHSERIFPIGRLDKPSEGLIFLTSDGDIVNKILRAENAHDKEYLVTVDKPIDARFEQRMSQGVPILDTVTKPCIVKALNKFQFKIILTQGLNRQIRRMCKHLGYNVTKLKRVRIMSIGLGNLQPGQWRDMTTEELLEINQAVAGSTKTAHNSVPLSSLQSNKGSNTASKSAPSKPESKQPYKKQHSDYNRSKSLRFNASKSRVNKPKQEK